jgi:hypothetical protein
MRLFIGRAEGSETRPLDLYAAFEAICQDEAEFREELQRYAMPDTGPAVTPMQVPPLVTQRFPEIRPTATNKMYNAFIRSQNFGGEAIARTLAPTNPDLVAHNQEAARELLRSVRLEPAMLGPASDPERTLAGTADSGSMIRFLEAYRFSRPGVLERVLGFLRGELGDPEIDRWLLVWPQLVTAGSFGTWAAGEHGITVIERGRNPETGRFGAYTVPGHMRVMRTLALGEGLDGATPDTIRLASGGGVGVALMYAVKWVAPEDVTIGFALLPPRNGIEEKTRWGVRVRDLEDEPIVSASQLDASTAIAGPTPAESG